MSICQHFFHVDKFGRMFRYFAQADGNSPVETDLTGPLVRNAKKAPARRNPPFHREGLRAASGPASQFRRVNAYRASVIFYKKCIVGIGCPAFYLGRGRALTTSKKSYRIYSFR